MYVSAAMHAVWMRRIFPKLHDRLGGDQGVVIFGIPADDALGRKVAIKFFSYPELFNQEMQIFQHPDLQASGTFPALVASSADHDRTLRGPRGVALPPFIIMEAGESLRDFDARIGKHAAAQDADVVNAIQVCSFALHAVFPLPSLHEHKLANVYAHLLLTWIAVCVCFDVPCAQGVPHWSLYLICIMVFGSRAPKRIESFAM
jgi:hypothetical protein